MDLSQFLTGTPQQSQDLSKFSSVAHQNMVKNISTHVYNPQNPNNQLNSAGPVLAPKTTTPTKPTGQQLATNIGTGLIDQLGGVGASDLKNAQTEKNPLKAGAELASGLGKSAFSAATFIPKGIFDITKDFIQEGVGSAKDLLTGKGGQKTPAYSNLTKSVDQAQQEGGGGWKGAPEGFLTGLTQTAPVLGLEQTMNELPNNTNDLKGGKALNTKIESYKAAQTTKAASQVDNLVGSITQGKIADIAKAKSALGSIDTEGIKNYKDLSGALDNKIQTVSEKLDQVFDKTSPKEIPLDKLNMKAKVGGQTITHNFVNDALNQLKELYQKTNDPTSAADVAQLTKKAQDKGLSIKEVNNLAKQYGNEFSSKAFNKMGDPLTSVNAQAFENTRSGLKTTARQQFNNPVYQEADAQLSNLIKTRDLTDNMNEAVNKLQQKIQTRSFGAKAGALAAKVFDTLSGGAVKGAVNYFIPRGEGLKTLNALDLQKSLSKNLGTLNEVLNKNLPEADVMTKLQKILDEPTKPTVKARK